MHFDDDMISCATSRVIFTIVTVAVVPKHYSLLSGWELQVFPFAALFPIGENLNLI